MTPNLVPGVVDNADQFIALRRDLHAHPELSYEEHRTSNIVAEKLKSWGIEVHRGIAKTGVVGILRSGSSSAAVGLRADMDALPIAETNTFHHASVHAGRMHACGHDGHTVMLLAAAHYLALTKDFDGTVCFIFQPAEERGAGAQKMIAEGLFDRFPCDAVFAVHNWPGIPAGSFAVRKGPMMAGTAGFEVTVQGKSSHAAMPHLGVDPILVACQVAMGLQMLISRSINPVESAVLSVTQIHAGDSMNSIAESACLKGTVRAFSSHVFDQIGDGIERISTQVASAFGATVTVQFTKNYPPTINDAAQTEFATSVMRGLVGDSCVDRDTPLTLAAEDFSYMLRAKPGCYAFIGNDHGTHRLMEHGNGPCILHNSSYDFNDDLVAVGASYWVRLAEAFLRSDVRKNV